MAKLKRPAEMTAASGERSSKKRKAAEAGLAKMREIAEDEEYFSEEEFDEEVVLDTEADEDVDDVGSVDLKDEAEEGKCEAPLSRKGIKMPPLHAPLSASNPHIPVRHMLTVYFCYTEDVAGYRQWQTTSTLASGAALSDMSKVSFS